jgi:hypothetical protein
MKNKTAHSIILALVFTVFLVLTAVAIAQDKPTYIGTDKCKMCHKGEKHAMVFEKWSKTAHAKSMAGLDAAKGENKDPKCLKCHTTGYGAGGYGSEGMDAVDLAAVGCEACHGPGSQYKSMATMKDRAKAVAAGLIIPTEATCKKCHNADSPTMKGEFKFAASAAKIAHAVPDSLKSK